jgi:hypothetical protein
MLPEGIGRVADGSDVVENGKNPPTHHTIFATVRMPMREFIRQFLALPWMPMAKKK